MHRERLVCAALINAAVFATVLAIPGLQITVFTVIGVLLLIAAGVTAWQRQLRATYICSGIVLALSSIVVLGYLYGANPSDRVGVIAPMTLMSAVALFFAALAILSVIPGGIIHWVIYGHDAGAIMMRRILPVALIVLPALGLLRLVLERSGRDTDNFALAANITVASAALVAITIQSARRLRTLDEERTLAAEALRDLNEDLAELVRDRSEELERERTRVALLRDRDRIARDLHDRVIQRLFASGLQLTGLQATLDPRAAGRVDGVVNEIDYVIRELRKTIFALETSVPDDAAAALSATVHRVGRILGFSPTLTIEGDTSRLSPELSTHLLAVAHEALSNAIRHARATTISVVLDVRHDTVLLAVEDDGIGLPKELANRSGLANIDSRARELGGTLSWGDAVPHGTLLIFEVPLLTRVARVS